MDEHKKPDITIPDKRKPADIVDKTNQPGSNFAKWFTKWNPPGDFVASKRSFWGKLVDLLSRD